MTLSKEEWVLIFLVLCLRANPVFVLHWNGGFLLTGGVILVVVATCYRRDLLKHRCARHVSMT
jgi:hypothetical protein